VGETNPYITNLIGSLVMILWTLGFASASQTRYQHTAFEEADTAQSKTPNTPSESISYTLSQAFKSSS
jgi:hypothetical protein